MPFSRKTDKGFYDIGTEFSYTITNWAIPSKMKGTAHFLRRRDDASGYILYHGVLLLPGRLLNLIYF